MSGYLLDTNVISRLAPGRYEPSTALRDWIITEGAAGRLYIAAITIAEIERGIRKLDRKGGQERAAKLADWLDGIGSTFKDRILPFDADAARIAGEMADDADASGTPQDLADVMIAATAKAHGLTVVTNNIRHFEPLDVSVQRPPE
ncbi:type II toxin-antitoxin system VapC family toxin [Rhizobium sp. XQZ8]|uniref:type II toxin-antitoxin system VapC family toxin n=1 Tax=Rhizobium populisoli TaxID=2859785 RepID=UPI001C672196|nr:type II toxin-antitoxin system VapC family toxin [Rhizobium populisoli]MBW6421135.1 type II toxin-antitoxin system VapC family toxin [Rhizobium populisoli]